MASLEKITIRSIAEECFCLYCGMLLSVGDTAILDEPLETVFCSKKCDSDYRAFSPEEDKNNPL